MFIENQLEIIARELGKLKAQQAETLQLLRSTTASTTIANEKPVSTEEAAKQFGIAKQTLYQNAKRIKHTKRFGRLYFYPTDIREYLSNGKGGPGEWTTLFHG